MTGKKAALRNSLALVAVVATALVLSGCPTTQRRAGPPSVDRAEAMTRGGDHASAAAIYERLATETTGPDSAEFNLRAARSYLAAGRALDADRILALLPAGLTQQQALEQKLLRIQSALAQGRGDDAWRDISALQPPTAQPGAARYYETRQQVAIATGHLLDGIRAELSRERVISPGEVRTARSELLSQLRLAAERGASLAPPAGSDATVRGWLEAAQVALDNSRNPTLGATKLNAFRARNPSHPALAALSGEPTIGLPEDAAKLESAPHIALMLPLSGRTSAPAAQIRDGFLTAYYQLSPAARPRLRVYDTAVASFADSLAEATANGAEFIVGPLTREEVIAAADILTTRPTLLALNFLPPDRPTPEKFYQFALSPEDDARAVARFISSSGRRRGVVLTPEGDWGTRVASAFDEELRAAGGYVLGQASFGTNTRNANDFGPSIMQVLRTDDSSLRSQRIQATIGQKLELEPRRRPDIQFIFAPSQPAAARLLRPQLRFHLAGDIPTYTLGDAYEPHPTANQEIEGLMFPDMPWMLSVDNRPAEIREAATAAFGDSPSKRGRLFAFGFDALRIAEALKRGSSIDPQGLTGTLTLDAQGRIRRELQWVRIKSGLPSPLEPQDAVAAVAAPAQ
ncbi:MAG TPA: penicillin-binding protein activator [Steroidobacteraceae bacterium]|nr:penicillin-binding protein activator [Steroidobacteraceae bacterium]